jgi:hypothetical protein
MTADLPEVVASELKALRVIANETLKSAKAAETSARTLTSQYQYLLGRVDDIARDTQRVASIVDEWRARELREAQEIANAEYMAEMARSEAERNARRTDETLPAPPPPGEANGGGEDHE